MIDAPPVIIQTGIAVQSWDYRRDMFERMLQAGMTGARLSLFRNNAVHDLDVINQELPVAKRNRVEIVVNLTQQAEESTIGFSAWAADMALQLPQVKRFVIGNEPNSWMFWHGSVGQYVDMLAATTKAIHRVRPDAIVSGFGLDSTHAPLNYLIVAKRYAEQHYGGLDKVMDTLSIHAYASPAHAAILARQFGQLWQGPINVDEAGGPHATHSTNERRMIQLLAQIPQIQNVFFYRSKS